MTIEKYYCVKYNQKGVRACVWGRGRADECVTVLFRKLTQCNSSFIRVIFNFFLT